MGSDTVEQTKPFKGIKCTLDLHLLEIDELDQRIL